MDRAQYKVKIELDEEKVNSTPKQGDLKVGLKDGKKVNSAPKQEHWRKGKQGKLQNHTATKAAHNKIRQE